MRSSTYDRRASWAITLLAEVSDWIQTLSEIDYQQVVAALEALAYEGPNLGRPFVDHIKGSRYSNMKELRPRATNIRLLFAFDPKRTAVFLVGGDKRDQWQRWYDKNIPIADIRLDEYLSDLESEIDHGKKDR
jgi:hypothetical protein